MKKIFAIIIAIVIVFPTQCWSSQSNSERGWLSNLVKGLGEVVNHTVKEYEKTVETSPREQTRIDAWNSGTGGKALVISEIAVDVAGGLSKKDVSALKERIHKAESNLNNNENFQANDVMNWAGALCTVGDELIDEHKKQSFEKEVRMFTDPTAPGYSEELALRVESVDYDNRKIIFKSNEDYWRDLVNYRKAKREAFVSQNISSSCGISVDEYNILSNDKRAQADLIMLNYTDPANQAANEVVSKQISIDEPVLTDYKLLVEEMVISDYDFNSSDLSSEQIVKLDSIAGWMSKEAGMDVVIVGHTCSVGTENNNYTVGERRAAKASDYLVAKGIDESRISIKSEGSLNPIADNEAESGRKLNRRLTFVVTHK